MPDFSNSNILINHESFDKEYRIINQKNKEVLWVHGIGKLEFDNDGKLINIFGTIQDITDRKNAEIEQQKLKEQIRRAQKLETIGTLAGGIAHDFNNILTPIFGYSQLSLEMLDKNSELYEFMQSIYKASSRAKDLVNQILTFSRPVESQKAPIELSVIIKEALKLLRPAIPATISIIQDISDDCGSILADISQMHQVIMNLCTNAFQAMEDNGGTLSLKLKKITVSAEDLDYFSNLHPGEHVKLVIKDTGIGMDAKTIDRIFEPFFTTKKVGKGTGLGLSVVHGIVKGHNGDIHVYSEPGAGTEFKLFFPVYSDTAKIIDQEQVKIQGGSESIIMIDDEIEIIALFRKILTKLGYQIEVFTNSTEALKKIENNPDKYDLLITDLTMPGKTGIEIAEEIQKIKKDMPVILISGYSAEISEEKMTRLGIKGVLQKPLVIQDLVNQIKKIFNQ